MALRDLRMLDVWRTSDAPVRELVDWMQAAEQRDKVLSVSFGHGFPWADVPDVGAKTVVVTDGDPALAEAVAKELGDRVWALRETYRANLLDVAETMAAIAGGNGCTVVADISDNAGLPPPLSPPRKGEGDQNTDAGVGVSSPLAGEGQGGGYSSRASLSRYGAQTLCPGQPISSCTSFSASLAFAASLNTRMTHCGFFLSITS
jgi:hypothetical protein